jgi:hypothetical protein
MSLDETKNIGAIFIIEVAGRPPEHLTETLGKIIEKMKEEKGVDVKDYKINEPVLMKDQKDFYTNFAEIELEVENSLKLLLMVFGYMPAHVEIIHPESIKLTNDGFGGILNELARRLHGYDEIARIIQIEKNILEKKLKSILEENKKSEKKRPEEEKKRK